MATSVPLAGGAPQPAAAPGSPGVLPRAPGQLDGKQSGVAEGIPTAQCSTRRRRLAEAEDVPEDPRQQPRSASQVELPGVSLLLSPADAQPSSGLAALEKDAKTASDQVSAHQLYLLCAVASAMGGWGEGAAFMTCVLEEAGCHLPNAVAFLCVAGPVGAAGSGNRVASNVASWPGAASQGVCWRCGARHRRAAQAVAEAVGGVAAGQPALCIRGPGGGPARSRVVPTS